MALIKQSNSALVAREAIVLDLGDLSRQGEAMLRAARREADELLTAARAERERILAGAADEGRAQGHTAGHAAGLELGRAEGRAAALEEHRAALDAIEQAWVTALDAFLSQRDAYLAEARQDLIRLALMIAERVIKRTLALDPSIVADQLASALSLVLRPSRVITAIHPDDRPVIEAALPALARRYHTGLHIELADDPRLERGSCVLRLADATTASGHSGGPDGGSSLGGEIDAGIRTQIDRITAALLPGTPDEPRVTGGTAGASGGAA